MARVAAIVFVATVALIACTEAGTYKCYTCDSAANPLGCTQSVFTDVAKFDTGCTCCTKKNRSGVVTRGCEKSTVPTDCFPLVDNAVCLSDLCNSATPTKTHVTMIALSAAVALYINRLFRD
jgi:hypothetical protein